MLNEIWCFRNRRSLVCSVQHAEQHTHMWTHPHPRVCARAPIALWGHSQHRDAPARCVRKPALAALCVLEKHKDAPHNCCLPCACFLYFSFVSWSRNHRLIPIKACKRLPLLDQTQKNSSRWLKHIYIPQVITSWHSPLYSFPRVKAEILVHFYIFFLSNIFSIFQVTFFLKKQESQRSDPHGSWHLLQSFLLTQRRPREGEGTVWLQSLVFSLSWAPTLHPPGSAIR